MHRSRCNLLACFLRFCSAKDDKIDAKKKRSDTTIFRRNFVESVAVLLAGQKFTNHESLPSLQVTYQRFREVFPSYEDSCLVDEIRAAEYEHLHKNGHVCMDYFGIGLFSYLQQLDLTASSLTISYSPVNLVFQAVYGAPEEGSLEHDITNRIYRFLNMMENDYSIVFTATRGSAFKVLSDYYPFNRSNQLLTVYDYENEELNWMVEISKKKGAKVTSASFTWPSFKICSVGLQRALSGKKKPGTKGLFVFPGQSRLTGTKYSFEWMYQAQQNGWHVLLDACALAPKDMDSLGLTLFRPDFIICSFFKVYGNDPSGFGCLFVKKSSALFLDASAAPSGIGIVKVVPTRGSIPSRDRDHETGAVSRTCVGSGTWEITSTDYGITSVPSSSTPTPGANMVLNSQGTEVMQILVPRESENMSSSATNTDSISEYDVEVKNKGSEYYHPSNDSLFENTDSLLGWEDPSGEDDNGCESDVVSGRTSVEAIQEIEGDTNSAGFTHQRKMLKRRYSSFSESQKGRELEVKDEKPSKSFGREETIPIIYEEEMSTSLTVEDKAGATYDAGNGKTLTESISSSVEENPGTDNSLDHTKPLKMKGPSLSSNKLGKESLQIQCRSLDHAESVGLFNMNARLRYLTNWLITALLKLRHPSSENGRRLVKIYGPKVKFQRGPSIAFNIYDWKGELVEPILVQRLADRFNISLSYGFLRNIRVPVKFTNKVKLLQMNECLVANANGQIRKGDKILALPVVHVILGFLTNFEDVYKLWAFIARFLDADFVAKERIRYRALNQQMVEL